MRWLWTLVLLGAPVAAQDRAALTAVMQEAGAHETPVERFAMKVQDCTLQTFRWMLREGDRVELWSSFTFDMGLVQLTGREADGFVIPCLAAVRTGAIWSWCISPLRQARLPDLSAMWTARLSKAAPPPRRRAVMGQAIIFKPQLGSSTATKAKM